ncbi:MAG: ribosomal protein S18-alanine N-acetyltransferase [Oscillospiraceae bacterium]|nr:ribosomal protein S18-alanine N-acetyltransferase [Oscillospiraceae bacterium]
MIEYVLMSEEHVAQIAELEKLCFSDPWSINSITYELTNPLSLWLVAVEDSTVIGYIGSQTVLGETDMMNVAVHPEYRKQGIGTGLIQELLSRLKDFGVYCLTLEVRVSNTQAITLYDKLGFVQTGKRPNYYSHPKEDALIMRLDF